MFFKKEIFMTENINMYNRVKEAFNTVGIPYTIRIKNKNSSPISFGTSFSSSRRSRMGTYGENQNTQRIYYIYVDKVDFEKAKHVLNNIEHL